MTRKLDQLAKERHHSIWIDDLSRSALADGRVDTWLNWGVRGMTTNPSIFEKAIREGSYRLPVVPSAADPEQVYWTWLIEDVRAALEKFLPIYEATESLDGYVSLEVSPKLCHQTEETIAFALHLKKRCLLPNLMVKIPATPAGIAAIAPLIEAGVNLNMTLIFTQEQHRLVQQEFRNGLDRRVESGLPIDSIAAVASVFVSRIDAAIAAELQKLSGAEHEAAAALENQVALANCALIYQDYLDATSSPAFKDLLAQGAQPCRVLWASTGTKSPLISKTHYADHLAQENTVDTLPLATLENFLESSELPTCPISEREAADIIEDLEQSSLSLDSICEKLLADGLAAFELAFQNGLSAAADVLR